MSAPDQGMTLREMVMEIRADLKELTAKVPDKSITEDQEDRIRDLERWKYAIPPSFVMAAGAILAGVLR